MKIVIVYDSVFGNTKEVATQIESTFKELGDEVYLTQVKDLVYDKLMDTDLLIIGSPTRGFKPTADIVSFIKTLNKEMLSNTKVALFDTRMDINKVDNKFLTFMAKRFGFANDTMSKLIYKKGGTIIGQPKGFVVDESEGPLRIGEAASCQVYVSSLKV